MTYASVYKKQERISVECKPPAYSLNRQKHRQTDMTENITYPHTRVVMIFRTDEEFIHTANC